MRVGSLLVYCAHRYCLNRFLFVLGGEFARTHTNVIVHGTLNVDLLPFVMWNCINTCKSLLDIWIFKIFLIVYEYWFCWPRHVKPRDFETIGAKYMFPTLLHAANRVYSNCSAAPMESTTAKEPMECVHDQTGVNQHTWNLQRIRIWVRCLSIGLSRPRYQFKYVVMRHGVQVLQFELFRWCSMI